MTRRKSRLHTLEQSVRKPRPSQAKSRALTVMRLEGSTGMAATQRPRVTRLPKDLEDQIAVVRGRALSKPSRGLLQLEERLLRTHATEPAVHRYEHAPGPARHAGAPVPTPPVPRAQAMSFPEPFGGNVLGGRYAVESFEEPATPASVSGTGAGAPLPGAIVLPARQPRADAPPMAMQQPVTAKDKRALNRDQRAMAADFERDVAAMLDSSARPATAPEDKHWEDTLRNAGSTAPAQAEVPAQTEAPPPPTRTAHTVFDQMGLAMNYANSFDLGAVDLSARFDQFEKELAVEAKPAPGTAPPVPVRALELDDFDLVADLADLSGAQSVDAPAIEAPAQAALASPPNPDSEQAATPAG